jgi:general secretion pathway protein D
MAKSWVERIDQAGGTGGGTRFFVYQVKNGKAENLAGLVSDLFSSRRTTTTAPSLAPGARPTEIRSAPFGQTQPPPQTTTSTVTPAPGAATFTLPSGVGTTASEVRVIADKDTNSLLILASPGDYDVIIGALKQLDVVRRQVLVEVFLAEVKLTDDLKFGLNYFINTRNNTRGTLSSAFGSNTSGLPTLTGAGFSPTGVVPNFAPGLQLINMVGNEVRAVLNTLGTDGRSTVLAAPQIMVLDNEKAEIKVGDRVSVQTQNQTTTTTGTINSFQYLETGILLAVTPRINSGGMVTLEINQEVSAAAAKPADGSNPDINTRSAKTSVVVASGESVVLGGLIRENNSRGSAGIPLLSKIPILGIAFGSQTFSRERTELVLVITPKIISDPYQARAATEELRDKLPALKDLMPKTKQGPPEGMPPPGEIGK